MYITSFSFSRYKPTYIASSRGKTLIGKANALRCSVASRRFIYHSCQGNILQLFFAYLGEIMTYTVNIIVNIIHLMYSPDFLQPTHWATFSDAES